MRIARLALVGLLPAVALATTFSSEAGPANGTHKLDVVLRARDLRGLRDATPVSLFVKTTDAPRTRRQILALGGTVGVVAGDILTARLPQNAVAKLADAPDVARLEGARTVRRKLDKVLPAMKVDQLHSGAAGTPYKGTGVVVGVVDYGLDLDHDAFKKPGGASRVVALWDQAATTGAPPAGYAYGTECTAASLAARTCAHTSTEIHGTHVTGIAAGNAVGGAYVGVAPEADIVFVNVGTPGSVDAFATSICEGASYVFGVAAAAGKPAVVNMSLGEQSGPHDGTSLADQCLDNLAGPGRILVAAAGNEGEGGVSPVATNPRVASHVQLTAAASPKSVRFLATKHPEGYVDLEGSVWFDDPSVVSVRLGAFEGNGAPVYTSLATTAAPVAAAPLVVGTHTLGPVMIASASYVSGARAFQFLVLDTNGDQSELNDVTWILEVTGSGKVDAFIDSVNNGGFLTTNASTGVAIDNEMTIGFPAIAKKVLAVGSYATRNAWTPLDGTLGAQEQRDPVTGELVVLGALSGFSSHGPPRRAIVIKGPKPDITAPGEIVASALNHNHTPDPKRLQKASPSGYVLLEGTSMASPAVAGAIALMLQRRPTLTVEEIRTILDKTATVPAGVTAPSPLWGRGKIDALAAVRAISTDAGAPDAGSSSSSSSSTSGDVSSTSSTSSSSSSSSGVPASSTSTSSTSGFLDDNDNQAVINEGDTGCTATTHPSRTMGEGATLALAIALGALRRRLRRAVA